jgi:thymidylate synthase (FAD)
MPIWMAREWFRHTIGFARNEVSRRYVDEPPTFHLPEFVRGRAANKKQGSLDNEHHDNELMMNVIQESTTKSFQYYNNLIGAGVPPEQARMVLPQNMMTEFIETGSLAAYARLCKLRMGADAQKEIQEVAKMVSEALAEKFPATWKVLLPVAC